MLFILCQIAPPRQAHQTIWSRFVNVNDNGTPGHNIPCDLHNEHLNRLCKECVRHLGANKTEKAICHFSRCMGPLSNILSKYDYENKHHHSSGSHTTPPIRKLKFDKVRNWLVDHAKAKGTK